MSPGAHIIVSLSAGAALWFITQSLFAGLLCFVTGVFVDIDHALEYAIHFGWKDISIAKIYQACEETTLQQGEHQFKKFYVILHAVEIAFALWAVALLTKNVYLLAVAVGYSTHLVMDSIRKRRLYPYFIVWRMVKRFDYNKLCR